MELLQLSLPPVDVLFDWIATGIRVVWLLVTVVSVISIVVMITHLVPRKEY